MGSGRPEGLAPTKTEDEHGRSEAVRQGMNRSIIFAEEKPAMNSSQIIKSTIGRKVRDRYAPNRTAKILQYEPLGYSSMSDVLLEFEDGSRCWHQMYAFEPADGLGPLPVRDAVRKLSDEESIADLRGILRKHVLDVTKGRPWPGMNFGKAHVGNMLLNALASYGLDPKAELKRACGEASSI